MPRRLLAPLAVVPLLLGGCSLGDDATGDQDDRPVVAVGDVIEGRAVLPEVTRGIEVRLPSGPAYFEVDDDLRAVPDDEVPGEFEDVPAADDARVLRLAWGREFLGYGSDVMRLMTGSDVGDEGLDVTLALVADGRRTEVPDVGQLNGVGNPDRVYVGVPRDADDLALEVTYDGVTQTVDLATRAVDPGRAAGLYDVPLAADRSLGDGGGSCPVSERTRGLEPLFACGVLDSWEVPYVDGLGWAATGQVWFVADASSDLLALRWIGDDDLTDYRTRLRTWEVLADGVRPVSTLPRRLGNQQDDKRVVFAVEPRERHRVSFRATYVGRPTGTLLPGAPARPTVTLERSVRVPDPDADD